MRKLWCAVIQRAVDDYKLGLASRKGEAQLNFEEAYEWLFSDSEEPASFLFLCETLNINGMAIRRGLLDGKVLRATGSGLCEPDEFPDGRDPKPRRR